ncbi:MAG TPA: FAD-dependent oxidoreductase [Firmicutes bacterium]|nr:FAD-dependent oxidoreductase [Bacillota bacterium]
MFTKLFSPGKIGSLTLKNRLIMPAMGSGMQDREGYVTERLYHYHRVRAAGGVGMDTVEIAAVHPTSGGSGLAIWDDKYIPKMKELVDVIHQGGAAACLQLWHAGRQTNSRVTGRPIVAPSPIPCPLCQEEPEELSKETIKELVTAYAQAARRAKEAGFDAVELHGAHGYLIAQFMSPYSNKRIDEYGGTLENRARFALEIIAAVRDQVGQNYPLLYRLSGEEMVRDGLTIEDTKKIAKILEKAGVDAIHVSIGAYESLRYTVPPMDLPRGFNVWAAAEVKKVVDIPVITVGRINDPQLAEDILAKGQADFIAIGRALLTDPEFPNKAQQGRWDEIRRCIACNQGCVDRLLLEGKHATCILNPECGREQEFEPLTPSNKTVVVVGGGVAGMEVARLLKLRGCNVTLFEATDRLGGQWLLAGVLPDKYEIREDAQWLINQVNKLGINVQLNTPADVDRIMAENPDAVVIATGSSHAKPNIAGVDQPHVVFANSVLKGEVEVGPQVVVIGGGATGLEIADFLAEQAHKVTVVESLGDIGGATGPARKSFLLERLAKGKVRILTEVEVLRINPDSVDVSLGDREDRIPADTVVIAAGMESNNELAKQLPPGVHVEIIGDAKEPGRATAAIYDAHLVARRI